MGSYTVLKRSVWVQTENDNIIVGNSDTLLCSFFQFRLERVIEDNDDRGSQSCGCKHHAVIEDWGTIHIPGEEHVMGREHFLVDYFREEKMGTKVILVRNSTY
jgi:hypothetical protein